MHQLLIVDDEPAICSSLTFALEDSFEVLEANDSAQALEAVKKKEPDIVLLDLKLGRDDGIEVLREIKQVRPNAVVIIMTAYGSIQSSVDAIKAGAFYYITKPIHMEELRMLLQKAVEVIELEYKVKYLNDKISRIYEVAGIVGDSSAMRNVSARIDKLRDVDSNVLITGESGTGKELVAKAIHFGGSRRNEPFETVNCAAIPLDLLESELFGHEKGAFTGAVQKRKGLFELADRGTLFLDEIGEMDPRLQAKLLRVVQDKEIMPVGSTQRKKVNVRILCATNRDLPKLVDEGRFREDLFFRLNVVNLHLPPLRERRSDIPALVASFLTKYSLKMGRPIPRIENEALEILKARDYRGNVRELENIIEKALVFLVGDTLTQADLPFESAWDASRANSPKRNGMIQVYIGQDMETIQKNVILETLRHYSGDKRKTAETLGISERKLWYKLKEYELGEFA